MARSCQFRTWYYDSARKSAENLGLEMKISDVEYQGDKTKATFYYTANGRVDFRVNKTPFSRVQNSGKCVKLALDKRRLAGKIGACGRELLFLMAN